MAGEIKRITFSEGVATTSPTPQTTSVANLVVFASTTAFLADKGVAVEYGDTFVNSTNTAIYVYDNSNWRIIPLSRGTVTSKSTDYTITLGDELIEAGTTNTFTLDFYTAVGNKGRRIGVTKTTNDINPVILNGSGSETIGGLSTSTVDTKGETAWFYSDDANWIQESRTFSSERSSFVPVFAGFLSTSAVNLTWHRVSKGMRIQGEFTYGSLDANEARLGTPSALLISNELSTNTVVLGPAGKSYSSGAIHFWLGTSQDSYMNVGAWSSSASTNLGPVAGNALGAGRFSIDVYIPIQNWK